MMDIQLPTYISDFGRIYHKEANDLLLFIKSSKTSESDEVNSRVNKFLHKFTMIPLLWEAWIRFENKGHLLLKREHEILLHSLKHFPVHELLFSLYFDCLNLYFCAPLKMHSLLTPLNKAFPYAEFLFCCTRKEKYEFGYPQALKDLKCPHKNLIENLLYSLAFSNSPQTKEILNIYEKNDQIYKDIIAVKDEEEKWIECLKRSNNLDCIIQNIEYRISNEPANTKIWKLYINFLHESHLSVLPIFQRYCRLFLEDKEMRKQYRKAIGDLIRNYRTTWWIDLIEIEKDFESENCAVGLMKSIIQNEFRQYIFELHGDSFVDVFEIFKKLAKANDSEIIFLMKKSEDMSFFPYESIPSLCKKIFNFSIPQNFCFPSYLINYITKQGNFYNLQNLKMSCKFFLYKIQANYCHMLVISKDQKNGSYLKQSLFTNEVGFFSPGFKNICITNSIIVHHPWFNVINMFHNCGIRYISLACQRLYYSDMVFLTSSGKVEYLRLEGVYVYYDKGLKIKENEVLFEEVLNLVPKTRHFHFGSERFEKNMVKYKHPVSINYFKVSRVSPYNKLDARHFCVFMMNNANKDSHFCVEFDKKLMCEYFKAEIIELIEPCWIIHDESPILTFEHVKH